MMEAGVIALTALIRPLRADREAMRNLMPQGNVLEIYCNAVGWWKDEVRV